MALLAAGAAAAATGIGMYLDAKYSIRSDFAQLRGGRRLQTYVEDMYREHGEDDWSFYHVLHNTYAINHLTKQEAFVFEDRSWTYRQFREEIGRLAEAFERLGIKNRTVVGMFVNNSPEFIMAWWALYKIGAISAPINTAISGAPIKHCLAISEAQFCITTHELHGTLLKAMSHQKTEGQELPLLQGLILYDYNTYPAPAAEPEGVIYLRHDELPTVTPQMADFPIEKRPKVGPNDAAQYLFTSGTTGMPKSVLWPLGYNHLTGCSQRWPGMQSSDRRWFICLPLFHGTATFAAMPGVLSASGTVIIARRFSRREFWAQVRQSRANAILYIGEMFRYLVQSPPDSRFPDERNHGVDLAFGLGLAPGVWRAVRERFGIPWIVEYYSASEATVSLLNSNKNDFGVGKVAHYGPILRNNWFGQGTFAIVRANLESGELIRDSRTGFCIKTRPGEVGEAICKITPPIQRKHDYVGTGGEEATSKKTLRDVFEKGDEYTRIGDALVMVSTYFHNNQGSSH
jgi:acyl-CoA synthetase (AMP-forming)/AMP-acid ligase II